MASTKRQKRSTSDTPARRKPTPAIDTPAQPDEATVVVLEAGDEGLNDAPTLTLPAVHSQPEPEFQPPAEPTLAASDPPPAEVPSARVAAEPAPVAATPPAPERTIAPPMSPADERAAFMRRRMVALAGLVVVLLLAGFLAYRFFAPQTAATPIAPPAPAAAPQANNPAPAAAPQANNPAPPAPAAAPQANNPAPPAPAAAPQANNPAPPVQTVGEVIGGCSSVAGLPVFEGATCTKQDQDNDDGQLKLQNTYTVNVAADDVRRFYENAFTQSGWTVTETDQDLEDRQWDYTVIQGTRELKVKVEAQQVTQGNLTEFEIEEK